MKGHEEELYRDSSDSIRRAQEKRQSLYNHKLLLQELTAIVYGAGDGLISWDMSAAMAVMFPGKAIVEKSKGRQMFRRIPSRRQIS